MHNGTQYDLVHGQGYESFKVGISAIFQRLSLPPFIMGADK